MSSASPIDSFVAAVRISLGTLTLEQVHELAVAAKKVRLAVEAGAEPSDAEWAQLFPDERVRVLGRKLLTQVSVLDLDFNATMYGSAAPRPALDLTFPPVATPAPPAAQPAAQPAAETGDHTMAATPQGIERKWHGLLVSIPSQGLPKNDGSGMLSSMELGRTIVQVSQGKGRASYPSLPEAGSFRDRFVDAARDAGLLRLIDDLPPGA